MSERHNQAESSNKGPEIYPKASHHLLLRDVDEDALRIIQRLQRSGYSAYVVGGGVRDLLLGKNPKDYDIATDATPRKIKTLFSNSRIIGRRFRLVHIYFRGGKYIEVATFRDEVDENSLNENSDVEDKHLRENQYGTEETDARRRDITINGLFLDPQDMSIIDYVGGFKDLQGKTIRMIGDPDIRIPEDPVRLLRIVRHAARSGFEIESKTNKALETHRALIKTSSQVRVYEEVKRDLTSGFTLDTFWLLAVSGILKYLIPTYADHRDALFRIDSSLAEALRRVDEYNRGESKLSHTITLAVLAFFLKNPLSDSTECAARFEHVDEIITHLRAVFSEIQTTRRDMHEIEAMLSSWLRISQAKNRVKSKSSISSEVFKDLQLLLTICDSVDLEYLNHYRSAPSRPKRKGKPGT